MYNTAMNTKNDLNSTPGTGRIKKATLAAGIIFIIVLTTLCIYLYRRQTISAAFYGIDEKTAAEIGKQISAGRTGRIVIKTLDSTKPIPKSSLGKYHLLFAWNNSFGEEFETIAQKSQSPSDIQYLQMPDSIAQAGIHDGKRYALPLLINHYELAFYQMPRKKENIPLPRTLHEFETYLSLIKKDVHYPFVCAGGEDESMLALISALAESTGGAPAVEQLRTEINSSKHIADILDIRLAQDATLRTVLDRIRTWQQRKLIHPLWYEAHDTDLTSYIQNKETGAVFMTLSNHRKYDSKIINYYDTIRFVPAVPGDHALIAPVLCAIVFKNTAGEENALARLVAPAVQEKLSQTSQLAPVSSRAAAHDMQADNVRFWAASCAAGPVPPVYASHALAEEIRNYLKN
jgi:hypothetical protein